MINVMEQFFSFIYSGEKLNDDKYHLYKHTKIFKCRNISMSTKNKYFEYQ